MATQLPHAVGLAYAAQYRGDDAVVMVYFGDGATSEGDFHEASNFAGVWHVPVVFVCQNNQWAISVPLKKQTHSRTIAQKALAYGFPGSQVDGNDILAVHAASREAVARARAGDGPTLIECVTYRLAMHTTADDPTKYRSEEEVAAWERKDPLTRFARVPGEEGPARRDGLEEAVDAEIAAAVARFEADAAARSARRLRPRVRRAAAVARGQRAEMAERSGRGRRRPTAAPDRPTPATPTPMRGQRTTAAMSPEVVSGAERRRRWPSSTWSRR